MSGQVQKLSNPWTLVQTTSAEVWGKMWSLSGNSVFGKKLQNKVSKITDVITGWITEVLYLEQQQQKKLSRGILCSVPGTKP